MPLKGTDLETTDKKYDAHVRLEMRGEEWLIFVDVFDSAEKRANAAHMDSDSFPVNPSGAKEATDYLREMDSMFGS